MVSKVESTSAAGNRAVLQHELKTKSFAAVIHERCKAMNFNVLKQKYDALKESKRENGSMPELRQSTGRFEGEATFRPASQINVFTQPRRTLEAGKTLDPKKLLLEPRKTLELGSSTYDHSRFNVDSFKMDWTPQPAAEKFSLNDLDHLYRDQSLNIQDQGDQNYRYGGKTLVLNKGDAKKVGGQSVRTNKIYQNKNVAQL
jgi:hypothetical protein